MKIDKDMAEILGIHLGDGCISVNKKYSEYYLGGDLKEEQEYHDKWVGPLFNKKIMLPYFNKKVKYKKHPKVGIYGFYVFDKKLISLFNKLGIASGPKRKIAIPKNILENKRLQLRFVRGLFDTDGNIYFDKNRSAKTPVNNVPNIKLDNVSKELIEQVHKIFKNFGLNPRLKKPYQGKRDKRPIYTLLIYRKTDIKFFIENIGFKNPKHITKWLVFKKLGYCPPRTSLDERKRILVSKKAYKPAS